MQILLAIERAINAVCTGVGRAVVWLLLPMVLLTAVVVVLRYGFNFGRIYLQEAIVYMHAAVFMLAAAWALRKDRHVRVDVFYRGASRRHRAWVNLFGTLFLLLPSAGTLLWLSLDYAAFSWNLRETSREPDGLPFVYLLKTVIPVMAALLILQGVSALCHHLRTLLEPGA